MLMFNCKLCGGKAKLFVNEGSESTNYGWAEVECESCGFHIKREETDHNVVLPAGATGGDYTKANLQAVSETVQHQWNILMF